MIKSKVLLMDVPRFHNEENFDLIIKNIDLAELQILHLEPTVTIYFFDPLSKELKSFAKAIFHKAKLIHQEFTITPMEEAGLRVCYSLKNLHADLYQPFLKKFKMYFTKLKGNKLSEYQNEQDFVFDIFRLSDGMKAMDPSKVSEVQENHCSVDSDIPRYLTDRLIPSYVIPYHRLVIPYKEIEEALNTLHINYYTCLNVWFFPEREPRNAKLYEKQYNLKKGKTTAHYLASWRRSNDAIQKLADNIIFVQSNI